MILHTTMKMPSSCTMCWFAATCEVWINEIHRWKSYDKRLDNCPLVDVDEKRVVCNRQRTTAWVAKGEQP